MNVLLVDIGGTKIRLARSNGKRLLETVVFNTPAEWPKARNIFFATAKKFFGHQKIHQVVIGIPGMVSLDKKKILRIPNLPKWPKQKIVTDLQKLSTSIQLENDAVLNGLGEMRYGAGRGYEIVGFLTLSTGINGARFVRSQQDAHAFPVELRHMFVQYKNTMTTLGRAISGRSLERQYKRKPELLRSSVIWQQVTHTLAQALVNLGLIWSPEIIIIGGSITKSISLVKLRQDVKANWFHAVPMPRVVKGKLTDLSGLYGALALAQQKAKKH